MSLLNEEKAHAGDGARSERQEPSEWRYVETQYAAEVEIGDVRLRLHWRGVSDSNKLRSIVRYASAAPALYEAVKELIGVEYRHGSPAKREAEFLAAIQQARAALALVDGPQTNEKLEG